MSQSTSDFLNKIPAFKGLAQEELVDILRTLQPVSYQAGEIIFRENSKAPKRLEVSVIAIAG